MKSILSICIDQLRSGEIWRRAWEFSRFKKYGTFNEWKKGTSRQITKDDVPAIILTLAICIGIIVIFNMFFKGRTLTYAILGAMVFFRILQSLIERFQKNRKGDSAH